MSVSCASVCQVLRKKEINCPKLLSKDLLTKEEQLYYNILVTLLYGWTKLNRTDCAILLGDSQQLASYTWNKNIRYCWYVVWWCASIIMNYLLDPQIYWFYLRELDPNYATNKHSIIIMDNCHVQEVKEDIDWQLWHNTSLFATWFQSHRGIIQEDLIHLQSPL